jgi:hypothetical protein
MYGGNQLHETGCMYEDWLSSGILRLVHTDRRFRGAHCIHHQGDEVLMMEAVSTCETSVNIYHTTRLSIPEDSHLYTRRREYLKSHLVACSKFHANSVLMKHTGETILVQPPIRRMFCSSCEGHVDEKGEDDVGCITSTLLTLRTVHAHC